MVLIAIHSTPHPCIYEDCSTHTNKNAKYYITFDVPALSEFDLCTDVNIFSNIIESCSHSCPLLHIRLMDFHKSLLTIVK